MVVNGQVRLLLPVLLALHIHSHGRVGVGVGVVHRLRSRWVGLEDLPALAVVQLHPVVLAVFDLSTAQGLLNKEGQLDTILSRCRVVRFDPLPEPELARRLADTDGAIIMKLGRNFPAVRRAL